MPHVAASFQSCGQAEKGQGAEGRDNGLAQDRAETAVARLLPLENSLTFSSPFSVEGSQKGGNLLIEKSVAVSIASGCSVGFDIITVLSR